MSRVLYLTTRMRMNEIQYFLKLISELYANEQFFYFFFILVFLLHPLRTMSDLGVGEGFCVLWFVFIFLICFRWKKKNCLVFVYFCVEYGCMNSFELYSTWCSSLIILEYHVLFSWVVSMKRWVWLAWFLFFKCWVSHALYLTTRMRKMKFNTFKNL